MALPLYSLYSRGVNMYAMLTGCLPYTVEPFNITALHAKMLENKMNPIPDHLSKSKINYPTSFYVDVFIIICLSVSLF